MFIKLKMKLPIVFYLYFFYYYSVIVTRSRKINVLFQVQKVSKLDVYTQKNYKDPQNYKIVFLFSSEIIFTFGCT